MDTSADPPLLKVDVANQKWSGGGGNVPSWERPYPSPRCAAVVRIVPGKSRDTTLIGDGSPLVATGAAPARATTARLDVRSAVATVRGVSVRALADRKAFLIEADQEVSLKEIKAGHLPAAQLGEDGGVKWLHMKLPGDEDYSGMEYALARRR